MEETDRAIVAALSTDGRLSYTDLADRVGLSVSAVHQRVRRLQTSIECARQLYSQRAELEGTGAAGLLDQQLASVVSQRTPFGEALGAAVQSAERVRTA